MGATCSWEEIQKFNHAIFPWHVWNIVCIGSTVSDPGKLQLGEFMQGCWSSSLTTTRTSRHHQHDKWQLQISSSINFQTFFGRCWELNMFSSEHGTWVKKCVPMFLVVPFWRFRPWIFLTSPTWTWSIGMGIWSLAKLGRFIQLFSGLVLEFCKEDARSSKWLVATWRLGAL